VDPRPFGSLPGRSMADRSLVVYLCTGNAARSVMATVMTRARTDVLDVRGAGTHSIEGLPMSRRTRDAMAGLDLADGSHRSHQLLAGDVSAAALVVAFAPEHVRYVRRNHPEGAAVTATLKRLARDLPEGDVPLARRVAAMNLAEVELQDWEEVVDPAGQDLPAFESCAIEIDGLLKTVLPRLTDGGA
jgi:protein-tyrosine-phosphatase